MNCEIQKINSEISLVKLESISFLAFINIITKFKTIHYDFQKTDQYFYNEELKQDNEYKTLLNSIKELQEKTQLENLMVFGLIVNTQIQIKAEQIHSFVNFLLGQKLSELKDCAKILGDKINFPIAEEKLKRSTILHCTANVKQTAGISIIDADKSFTNKVLFYYLFPNSCNPLSEVLDKTELMTMERQEKYFEDIFQSGVTATLPEIIHQAPFCSMQIIDQALNIFKLIQTVKPSISLQPISIIYHFPIPEKVVKSGNQEEYLTLMNKIKKYFTEKNNPNIIPMIVNQCAVVNFNLCQFEILKQQEFPLAKQIIKNIQEHFSFLN